MTTAPSTSISGLVETSPTTCRERLIAQVVGAFAQENERLLSQLGKPYRLWRYARVRQVVLPGNRQQQLLLDERLRFKRRVADGLDDDRQVELTLFEETHQRARARFAEAQGNAGVAL